MSIKLAAFLALVTAVGLLAVGISLSKQRAARFMLTAFAMLMIGVFFFVLHVFGILSDGLLTTWGIHMGAVFFVLILSIGLADKINALKIELLETEKNISALLRSLAYDRRAEVEAEGKTRKLNRQFDKFFPDSRK